MSQLLLGVDIGTYSAKGVLVTPAGEVVRTHVIPHEMEIPRPGWAEHDPEAVWWGGFRDIVRTLLDGHPYSGSDVAGVAVSAIGPCLLPLDESGRPLRKGILYGVDTRAAEEIELIEAEFGKKWIFEHSLMSLSSQAVGPKLLWLKRQEPEVWEKARIFTTASAFLIHRLTGRHVMDHHTASHYMPLYAPRIHAWDPEMLAWFGVEGRLPDLGWSDELAGRVSQAAAEETGLLPGTPVAVGAVDALSEAISVGVVDPGELMIMYGSTAFFILVQDEPTPDERLWTVAGAFRGQWNLAAGMATTGSLTRWFRDHLAPDLAEEEAYRQLFSAAAKIPAGAEGLLLLPYFSGERTPINDPRARGVLAGLTLAHTRAHLFRAVLEGTAFGIRHNLETFRSLGARIRRAVAVGGGASGGSWVKIVSDVGKITQELPRLTIGASYGDAFLAGLAAGQFERGAIRDWVGPLKSIEPDASLEALYDERYRLYLELYQATREIVHKLR